MADKPKVTQAKPHRQPRGAMKAADPDVTPAQARDRLKQIAEQLRDMLALPELHSQIRHDLVKYLADAFNAYLQIHDAKKPADLNRALGLVQDGRGDDEAMEERRLAIARKMFIYWKGFGALTANRELPNKWADWENLSSKLHKGPRALQDIWRDFGVRVVGEAVAASMKGNEQQKLSPFGDDWPEDHPDRMAQEAMYRAAVKTKKK